MITPSKLVSEQPNARPQNGDNERQNPVSPKPQPAPIYHDNEFGDYSCQAHHAISGNQALKGHDIEQWICKSKGKITKDTGYSVNNGNNGIWLPSKPKGLIDGKKWGELTYDKKKEVAFKSMDAGKGQFHLGPHDIVDPEDPDGRYHQSYKDRLIALLDALNDNVIAWVEGCQLCEDIDPDKGPFKPNWKINSKLDRVSAKVERDLLANPRRWKYFISKLALDYHKPICPHKTLTL
ncbi:AHH domain-containing protein [Hahella ganghwensis]|uniref:AHH domain-containing protein n=1 Tax=Hahella ganghwensis TaxID=286420 RepID=UPI0012F9C297|nr:AHH domain-containing protein [Hahella ganghwensis]